MFKCSGLTPSKPHITLVRTLSQTFDLRLGQSLSLMARHEDGSTAGLEAVPASPRSDTGAFTVTLRDPVAGVGVHCPGS